MSSDSYEQNDRRYQVFVSSTFSDLKEQRKMAINVIVNKGHIPIALENFSASNSTDVEVIKRQIQNSQVYLMILGHRYGEIIPGRDISYTEYEYELAKENDLLILPFILKEDEIKERRQKLNSDINRDKLEMNNFAKLCSFHDKIKPLFYKPWGMNDNFEYLVLDALNTELPKCRKRGLIWEPMEKAEKLLTLASKNEFIVSIVKNITSFGLLDKRCSEDTERKTELAKFFIQTYMDYILDKHVSLFFESGSTIAFLSREMIPHLARSDVKMARRSASKTEIQTNNVLTYLQFWLNAKLPCSLFPISSPEEPYGASYGNIGELIPHDPDYKLPPLNEKAQAAIEELNGISSSLVYMPEPTLLLGAASGLQLTGKHTCRFPREIPLSEERQKQVSEMIDSCYGPHVGSYHNKIFKRYMYSTGLPLMIFLTDDKIDMEIIVGRCHFILDSKDLSWEKFYKEHPLAFCIGCDINKMDGYCKIFETMGFDIIQGNRHTNISSFIARNSRFISTFESEIGMTS